MHRKNLIISVLGLLILGSLVAYKMYNKPHVEVTKVKAFETLTANALVEHFNNNEEAATTKYMNQVLEVSGRVSTIETENDVTTIYLESDDLLKSVSCEIDGELDQQLKEGDQVTVRGICAGSLMDVVLVQCKTI